MMRFYKKNMLDCFAKDPSTVSGPPPFYKGGNARKDVTLSPRPLRESGFADGRSEASPDSEQLEHTVAEPLVRNAVSVEQIQDRARVRGKLRFFATRNDALKLYQHLMGECLWHLRMTN